MLTIKTDGPGGIFKEPGYLAAWQSFRTIAIGLAIIVGLIMLASQAFGFDFFDAYTIKKIFHRLILAIIFIILSWDLLKFAVDLSNVLGNSLRAVIYQPFNDYASPYAGALQFGDWTTLLVALISGTAIVTLGIAALLSFLVTAFVGILLAFAILLLRHMIVAAAIMVAPVPIILSVLQGTQPVYTFWKTTTISMLVVFPIISIIIASGRVFAIIAYGNPAGGGVPVIQQLTAFGAFFGPYFMIPFAFKLAGGAIATVGGLVNDRGRGALDRVSGFRQNQLSKRYQDARSGKGGYVGANAAGMLYRRATLPGNALSRRGRARYRGESRALMQNSADEILKHDNGRMANDDDANALALQAGMGRRDFVDQYAQRKIAAAARNGTVLSAADAREQGREALGELESSYGARLGSGAMRVAAYKARAASVTGYNSGDYDSIARDAVSLEQDNLMSRADTIAALKANKTRADISSVGFGTWAGQLERSRAQLEANPAGPAVTVAQAQAMRRNALESGQPGALITGRSEAVEALAPEMVASLRDAQTVLGTRRTDAAALASSGTATAAQIADANRQVQEQEREVKQQLAAIAGRYDVMAQVSPQNARIMANRTMGETVDLDGVNISIREHIDRARNGVMGPGGTIIAPPDADFLNMRREYASAAAAQTTPTPTTTSDRRLKRDIQFIGKHLNGIKVYSFRYFWSDQQYIGVMAQDLEQSHPYALSVDEFGYYSVDYAILGMRMQTIEEWQVSQDESLTTVPR